MILSTSGNPELWLAPIPVPSPSASPVTKATNPDPAGLPMAGRMIVTSDSRGKPQLYEVSLSSGLLTRIPTSVSSHCTEAGWNPADPTRIAFTAAVGGGFQIYEYSFSTRQSKPLTGWEPCHAVLLGQ